MTGPTRLARVAALAAVGGLFLSAPGWAAAVMPVEVKPAETRPADTRPAGTRPADTKPADAKPAAPAGKPAEDKPPEPKKPADDLQLRARRSQRDAMQQRLVGLNLPEGDGPLDRYVRVWLDRGVLRLETTPGGNPSGPNPAVGSNGQFRVKGVNAVWTISRYANRMTVMGPNGPAINTVMTSQVTRNEMPPAGGAGDAQSDDAYYTTSFSASGTTLSISGQSVARHVSFVQNLSPPRNLGRVGFAVAQQQPYTIRVNEWGNGGAMRNALTLTARTLPDLRMKNPVEFRKFVVPLLTKVADVSILSPGAAEVYTVFGEVPADAAATAKVTDLLPGLDAEDFAVREQSAKQLRDLGPAGVLAALRLDRSVLTDEQAGQLGRFVADFRRLNLPDVATARQDPAFLADCLEHPDPAVRAAARRQVEQLLGRPVPYDPALSGDALAAAVDDVRRIVNEAASGDAAPTTKPAAGPQR